MCRDIFPIDVFGVCLKLSRSFRKKRRATVEAVRHTGTHSHRPGLAVSGCMVGLESVPEAKPATRVVSGSPRSAFCLITHADLWQVVLFGYPPDASDDTPLRLDAIGGRGWPSIPLLPAQERQPTNRWCLSWRYY